MNPHGFGFFDAGIMTLSAGESKKSKRGKKGAVATAAAASSSKGRGGKQCARASGVPGYQVVTIPPEEDNLKAYSLALAIAHHLLPVDLCTDPLPALAAVIAVLDASAENDQALEKDR